jgi:hypothetical protein
MRKPEQLLWDAMKRNAPAYVWLERQENVVSEGGPDVAVRRARNKQSWAELKCAVLPARATTAVLGKRNGLNQQQINWHLKAASMDIPTFVLVRDDAKTLYLLAGEHAASINEFNRGELASHSLASSWPEIFRELTKE